MTEDAGSSSLLHSFAEGLRTAHGDRLVDILGLVAYNIESLEHQPQALIRAAQELLPPLLALAADDGTHAMLRGSVAGVLALIGSACAQALCQADGTDSADAAADRVRMSLLDGFTLCIDRPTSVGGRAALAGALKDLSPVDDALVIARRLLSDPVAGVAALALESLAILEARAHHARAAPAQDHIAAPCP